MRKSWNAGSKPTIKLEENEQETQQYELSHVRKTRIAWGPVTTRVTSVTSIFKGLWSRTWETPKISGRVHLLEWLDRRRKKLRHEERTIIGKAKKKNFSREWFRSTDLWVMGPARFHCATLLPPLILVKNLFKNVWYMSTSAESINSKINLSPYVCGRILRDTIFMPDRLNEDGKGRVFKTLQANLNEIFVWSRSWWGSRGGFVGARERPSYNTRGCARLSLTFLEKKLGIFWGKILKYGKLNIKLPQFR